MEPRAHTLDNLRLIGPTGSNRIMAGELSRLARRAGLAQALKASRKAGPGTLLFPFDPALAALAVRYHRTSARVARDLYQSAAQRLEPLYEDLVELVTSDERGWLSQDVKISVGAHGVQGFAAGERQVVGTVKNAIVDGAASRGVRVRVEPNEPDVLLGVRMTDDRVVVSHDLAGRPMNQRGYRTQTGPAPLRENLAAMLVMLARHDPRKEPLLDPMGGTATIAIEAACLASGRQVWVPPRAPDCAALPEYRELCRGRDDLFDDTRARIVSHELDADVHHAALGQVERAEVTDQVTCTHGDFRDLKPSEIRRLAPRDGSGVVLSNPPYGVRLADRELGELYRDLGAFCRELRGFRAGFLVANPLFETEFGRGAKTRARVQKPLSNGPLKGYFLLYDL